MVFSEFPYFALSLRKNNARSLGIFVDHWSPYATGTCLYYQGLIRPGLYLFVESLYHLVMRCVSAVAVSRQYPTQQKDGITNKSVKWVKVLCKIIVSFYLIKLR